VPLSGTSGRERTTRTAEAVGFYSVHIGLEPSGMEEDETGSIRRFRNDSSKPFQPGVPPTIPTSTYVQSARTEAADVRHFFILSTVRISGEKHKKNRTISKL
jgi:hypothetical protein